jgi:hypothetical protein
VVLVVRPEVLPFLVEQLDVDLEYGEGERVEGQEMLSVCGLAVRLDHLAVDDDSRCVDFQRPGVEVKATARRAAVPRTGLCLFEGRPARGQRRSARGLFAAGRTAPIQRRALRRRPEATIGPSEGLAQRARRRRPRQPKRPELPGSDGRSLLRPSEEQGLVRGSRVLTAGVKLARRARVNAGSAAGRGYGVSPEGRAGRFVYLLARIYA